jgi:hypothetical protein
MGQSPSEIAGRKESRTVNYGPDLNPVRLHAVHQPIVADDYLPKVMVINLWDDPARSRERREPVGGLIEAARQPGRSPRRVFCYFTADILNVRQGNT